MEISTVILILSSGFAGAIAGGAVSLVGQWLNRRWQKEDGLTLLKRALYSEIIGIGGDYIGDKVYKKINNNSAKALLICGDNVTKTLMEYMTNIESTNIAISGKTREEALKIIKKNSTENARKHRKLIDAMKKELKL